MSDNLIKKRKFNKIISLDNDKNNHNPDAISTDDINKNNAVDVDKNSEAIQLKSDDFYKMNDNNNKTNNESELLNTNTNNDKKTNNKDSELLKHVYYEPKFCSDVQIIYANTCFHVHKCILAKQSKYFLNLFEGINKDNDTDNSITIPTLSVI